MKGNKKLLQELKLIFYKLETKSSNMYTVFQPFLIHLFYSFMYFCPVQHQNRDRDCTFGLVNNMGSHHKQSLEDQE